MKKIHCRKKKSLPIKVVSQEHVPSSYKLATGLSYDEAGKALVTAAYLALPREMKTQEDVAGLLQALVELQPQDPIEGMLCAQIVVLSKQGMHQLARAEAEHSHLHHTEIGVNLAVKLLRLMNEAIEALTRYRRKGEQKVVVQHINVNDTGKAIIGDLKVDRGGGSV
jgi:hypothetical protein